jgi:ParB-like chromosome segregation protein Spo0J
VKHVLINVDKIHPNPHRNFDRNPISEEQVEKLMASIEQTGFHENVVVREHPDKKGEYQLAYGHNRLEAIRRKNITRVELPVARMSNWDMYRAMVDENETQQEISPAIVFENVLVGVEMMESALEEIGEKGTLEAFNQEIGRVVPAGTTRPDNDGHGFEQARNHYWKNGNKTLGRRFVSEYLEVERIRDETVNAVLQSHYGKKLEAAKEKEAKSKREEAAAKEKEAKAQEKEAEAKDKEAKAAKDKAEAERLRKEAEKHRQKAEAEREKAAEARAEAAQLAAEAARIGAGTIKQDILLAFATTRQMTDFAAAIRDTGIPAKYHKKAMEHVIEQEAHGKNVLPTLTIWWYEVSGQGQRDRRRAEQEQAYEAFQRFYKHGDVAATLRSLQTSIVSLTADDPLAVAGFLGGQTGGGQGFGLRDSAVSIVCVWKPRLRASKVTSTLATLLGPG